MSCTDAIGRWVAWSYDGSRCCGTPSVDVYPAVCERIQHECGAWIETPRYGPEGKPIHERGLVQN